MERAGAWVVGMSGGSDFAAGVGGGSVREGSGWSGIGLEGGLDGTELAGAGLGGLSGAL